MDHSSEFQQERSSRIFIRLFYRYVLTLYRRRFQAVWLDDTAVQPDLRATLYMGNHNAWWDALTPLLLNERVLHQRARAVMDEEQLRRYPFFRRLGVFSIDRKHPRRALASLEHAAELLNGSGYAPGEMPVKKPGSASTAPGEQDAPPKSAGEQTGTQAAGTEHAGISNTPHPRDLPPSLRPVGLWFYPEGKLVRPEKPVTVEGGTTWLVRKLDPARTRIVPFASHIHHMRSDKPELFVRMGKPMDQRLFELRGDPVRDETHGDRISITLRQLRDALRRDSGTFDVDGHPAGGFRLLLGRIKQ